MKKITGLLILCITLSFSVVAQSKEEKDVTAAVENLRKAMISGDKKQLENIAADELSYGHSNGKIEDKAEFVRALVSGESDFVTIDLSEQTVKIVGNTAVVRHKLAAKTNNGGTPGSTNLGVLLVWHNRQGQWKLLARQAFKL